MNSNLSGGWSTFWNGLAGSGGFGTLMTVLSIVAAVFIVFVIVKMIFAKFRGRNEGLGSLGWALLVASIIVMPSVVIPLFLRIVDAIINMIGGIAGGV